MVALEIVMFEVPQLALYYRYSCFYCRRVMAELEVMGLNVELCSIDEIEHLDALLSGGGVQQVPALRLMPANGDENWMYESNDILRFLREL